MAEPLPVGAQAFLPFTRPCIDEATIARVVAVLRSGWLSGGPQVSAFEAALSAHCGGRDVCVVNSGTSALALALQVANVGAGDAVMTSPLTWVATANVIVQAGARPLFVDVDPLTRNLDLALAARAMTGDVRAIMPVDLAGLPVDRDALYALARRHGVRVIEDAAQSFGAQWGDQPIGAGGDFVAFSFHANKNITTGEGGALVLPSDVERARCERLRLLGVARGEDGAIDVDEIGIKANMTDIAAAIGLGQLARLAEVTAQRRLLARSYFDGLPAGRGLGLPPADFTQSNWHMFQVLLPQGADRPAVMRALRERGIGSGVHYPAVHLYTAYRRWGYAPGDFPVAEDLARRILTLPMHAQMSVADVRRVCDALDKVLP